MLIILEIPMQSLWDILTATSFCMNAANRGGEPQIYENIEELQSEKA